MIALVVFVLVTFFVPGKGPSQDIELILTISTFLFAIFAGFIISRSVGKYSIIKASASQEDALFLSLYKTSQLIGEGFSKKIRELIDSYYIRIYDIYGTTKYPYKENLAYFMGIWDEIRKVKVAKNPQAYGRMLKLMSDIESARNAASSKSRERLGKGRWSVLVILASIILFSIFYLRNQALYSQVITVLLATTLVLVLLIIRDLQNIRGTSGGVIVESGQEIFDIMGKPRYYNKYLIKGGWYKVPKGIKEYRLGTHRPGEEPKTKFVRNKK